MRRTTKLVDKPRTININNLVSKLRRLRTEVGQLLQQIDDALARIEAEAI